MIFGIGTDIVEIKRIEKAVHRNPRILNRLFTDAEIDYFKLRGMKPQHIAGSFSAKEAIVKAMGTGIRGFCWRDIELLRGSTGKPVVKLHNKAKEYAIGQSIGTIFITISHSQSYATAYAVAEYTPVETDSLDENSFVIHH